MLATVEKRKRLAAHIPCNISHNTLYNPLRWH